MALSEVWAKGGEGGMELAEEVRPPVRGARATSASPMTLDAAHRGEARRHRAPKVYRGDGVDLAPRRPRSRSSSCTDLGFGDLPICMAKTQYSFSDDPAKLGAPRGLHASRCASLKVSAGAGFVVALTGDIMTMPGLPKVPAAEKIDVDENGEISGLF